MLDVSAMPCMQKQATNLVILFLVGVIIKNSFLTVGQHIFILVI